MPDSLCQGRFAVHVDGGGIGIASRSSLGNQVVEEMQGLVLLERVDDGARVVSNQEGADVSRVER